VAPKLDGVREHPLLTPAELAKFLGVPIGTLYGWKYRRVGPPALRIGRHLRYRSQDVEAWLKHRQEETR
jgi:excisionase family DNA binding protein